MIRQLLMIGVICLGGVSANAQFKNINLGEAAPGSGVAGPSIAVNHKDVNNIVAASDPDNIYYTFDAGKTWANAKLSSPYGVFGNPLVASDGKGDFYAFHLSGPPGEDRQNEKSLDQIVCHTSKDGGKTWDQGTSIGYNPPKDQDKPWVTVDTKGNLWVAWTQFDKYGSADSTCQSSILLSSSSTGKKWSKPITLSQIKGSCLDNGNTTAGAVPAVATDGKIFVAWANQNKIFLDRSFDGGGVWLTNDIAIADQPGGWDLKIPGHDRSNGLPVLMVDKGKGVYRGCLYVVWADQRGGEDNTDVWFIRSNNYGDNWSSPMKMGKDSTQRHQYLPSMVVDQETGYIYVIYYDRSSYEDNQTDVLLAYSTDSGGSFKSVKISESPFVPVDTSPFGNHTNISAYNGIITPVWSRMDGGKTTVWTTVIKQADLIPPLESAKGKKKK